MSSIMDRLAIAYYALETHGCSDHHCVLRLPRGGMGTNGGCHCVRNVVDDQVLRVRLHHVLQCVQSLVTENGGGK